MTKYRAGWANAAILLALLLPSCTSSPSASSGTGAASYVRPPTGERGRPFDSRPLSPSRYISASTPGSSAAPMDVQMKQVSTLARVARPFPWRYVVVHHSASSSGDADAFGRAHKQRGWDGLGYHFVIGNGTGSGDGEIEVGYRWRQQSQGAHAGSQQYNRYGIGICLVGNFDRARPSARQLGSLERLVAFLTSTYRMPSANVIEHRDVRQTECPGRNFPFAAMMAGVAQFQRQITPAAVAANRAPVPAGAPLPAASSATGEFAQEPRGAPYH